jgi:hypothetical protein
MTELMTDRKETLHRIKKNIENAYSGFKSNYERYTKFRNFVFVTTMGDSAKAVNNELQRPSLEFNVVEAYLSRLCGEFSKNDPTLLIQTSDDYTPKDPEEQAMQAELIKVLEGYMRYTFDEAKKLGTQNEIYKDTLSGGYSSAKVYTDYIDEKSFLQVIKMEKTFDQTLVFFDALATHPDKADGGFCGEIVPMRKEDFMREFPEVNIEGMKYELNFIASKSGAGTFGPFNWSYKIGQDEIILVCDYYEKVKEKTMLLKLSNGRNMTKKEYKKFLKEWEEEGFLEQAPIEVDSRETEITTIQRYRMIQNDIISEEDTIYKRLPIKFIDGNSIITKDDATGACYQMTKPYFYNAEGGQRLKNFAGQVLADELENMRPAQIIASLESIPENYLDAYRKPKNVTTLVYNQFLNGNPQVPLNPPIITQRSQIPQEISQTFIAADAIIQNTLGASNTAETPMSTADISGKAIQELLAAGNMGSMPYITHYLLGLQSLGQETIDLIPFIYKTPRTLPILTAEGKREYVKVNQEGGVMLDYEPGAFKIKLEPGVSFGVQQNKALAQLTSLANAMPMFGQFLNEEGIDLVLDNVEMRNVETLRSRAEAWMQQQKQMKAQAQQQAQQQPGMEQQALQIAAQQVQSEAQIGMAKIQQQAQSDQAKTELKYRELEINQEKLQIELAKILADLRIEEEKLGIEQQRAEDERVGSVIDAAIRQSEHTHGLAHKHFERDMAMKAHEATKEASELLG